MEVDADLVHSNLLPIGGLFSMDPTTQRRVRRRMARRVRRQRERDLHRYGWLVIGGEGG